MLGLVRRRISAIRQRPGEVGGNGERGGEIEIGLRDADEQAGLSPPSDSPEAEIGSPSAAG